MLLSRFAAVMGTLFVTVGLLGFGSAFVSAPLPGDPSVTVDQAYGRLFGLFPVNVLHNFVHLAIGIAGLLAWRNVWSPLTYAQFLGGFYGVLTVLGLIPGANTMFGLVPIFAHDVWLHALTAALGIYFGWFHRPVQMSVRTSTATA
jgi:ABC-type transport system involved in multi-copper enzyme maturation permease subunit